MVCGCSLQEAIKSHPMCIERHLESEEWIEQKISYENTQVTPLTYACLHRQIESAEIILRQGLDVNISSPVYGTALESACSRGMDGLVELLLNHGAQVTRNCFERMGGPSPARRMNCYLHLLEQNERSNAVDLSLDDQGRMIKDSIWHDLPDLMVFLLDRGFPIDGTAGHLPLHSAALCGSIRCLLVLVGRRVNLNCRDAEQKTALMNCLRVEPARLLLDSGAQIDAVDKDGKSALHHAVSFAIHHPRDYSADYVAFLLDRGIDPNITDSFGRTAQFYANLYLHERVIEVFRARNIVESSRCLLI